ncbi:hypothetical protein BSKO_05958 [Bryopsis sp. KO-2023]|nr:hypothetical protein BSKO_05958 [Bryopsis sp. KO-2023]
MALRGVSFRHFRQQSFQVPFLKGWGKCGRSGCVSRQLARRASSLVGKTCQPCEDDSGALGKMGLCMAFDKQRAEEMLQQVDGWTLMEDENKLLRIRREFRSKNFLKALELFDRIAVVAEEEGHHPDLHLEGWNRASVELWTHSRNGLTDNDFIMAAKIDAVPKEDLLRKKKAKPTEG